MRGVRCAFAYALLSGLVAGRLGAVELVLDPWATPQLAGQLADHPEPLKGFSRVHVVVFGNGQTSGITACEPFASAPGIDPALTVKLTAACRRVGIQVSWAFDLLRWEKGGLPSPGLAERLPAWFELDRKKTCSSAEWPDRYASPWHAEVRAALRTLTCQVAAVPDGPDSLTLAWRLSPDVLLGYSQAARAAYIRSCGLDPTDLVRPTDQVQMGVWRQQQMTTFMAELRAAIREKGPALPVIAWSTGQAYQMGPDLRGRAADHWLSWLDKGLVDEVLQDAPWQAERWRYVWTNLNNLAKAFGGRIPAGFPDVPTSRLRQVLHPLVTVSGSAPEDLMKAQLAALRQQGAPLHGVVFYLGRAETFDAVCTASAALPKADAAPTE